VKTRDKALAMLLLSAFLASGCAAISPPALEQEEELTSEERATLEEQKRVEKWDHFKMCDSGGGD
jgi:PBP1b-binding outer membrane lipoprotein LpoB